MLPWIQVCTWLPEEYMLKSSSYMFVQLTSFMFWFIFNKKVYDNDSILGLLSCLRGSVFWKNSKNIWGGSWTTKSKLGQLRSLMLALDLFDKLFIFSQCITHAASQSTWLMEAELMHVYILCKISVFMPRWIAYWITATIWYQLRCSDCKGIF